MQIYRKDKIQEVQERFTTTCPQLQIRFYHKEHELYEGSSKYDEAPRDTLLTVLNQGIEDGQLTLDENMTVADLEKGFKDQFGLHIQVFRKSGDLWLQTSATDTWTLARHIQSAEQSKAYAR